MTIFLTLNWWMLVPLVWTLFFALMLVAWVRRDTEWKAAHSDACKVLCASWIAGIALILLTRFLP